MENEDDGDANSNWYTRTIQKRLLKGLKNLDVSGQVETILITALVRSVRTLRRVFDT